MSALIRVSVSVVPTSGKPSEHVAEVKAQAPLREVLANISVSADGKDLAVNDRPATLDTLVSPDDKIRVSERPAGS